MHEQLVLGTTYSAIEICPYCTQVALCKGVRLSHGYKFQKAWVETRIYLLTLTPFCVNA